MSAVTHSLENLVQLLHTRADEFPDKVVFRFLKDGETESDQVTYQTLHRQALEFAAQLSAVAPNQSRALLLFPSGIDFIAAFFGCLYASVIAIPVPLPRNTRQLPRIEAIAKDSGASIIITNQDSAPRLTQLLEKTSLQAIQGITIGAPPVSDAAERPITAISSDTLAFLQYTSGSTGAPKGVMVSHGNLLSNFRMLQKALKQDEKTVTVSWLPLFHDMGLIGNALQMIYLGATCILMPPEAFLMKPIRWLEAISRYKADHSGGPNFAYELCCKRIKPDRIAQLDLSNWDIAFVGAEPIRALTLEQFAETFAPAGFSEQAFFPCYGLAEASLFVTGRGRANGCRNLDFSKTELEKHHAQLAMDSTGSDTRRLVSCGTSWINGSVKIVNTETLNQCPENEIGEIWATGPHITKGYWNHPSATEATFSARLPEDPNTQYLRTGDLGFINQGELFICSRLKDHIIIAGRNHDPADIEESVGNCHTAIKSDCCIAFSVLNDERECLVVVTELERTARNHEQSEIIQAIRSAVAVNHDLMTHAISLIQPASCPRTSSGKVRRQACKQAWANNTLLLIPPHHASS